MTNSPRTALRNWLAGGAVLGLAAPVAWFVLWRPVSAGPPFDDQLASSAGFAIRAFWPTSMWLSAVTGHAFSWFVVGLGIISNMMFYGLLAVAALKLRDWLAGRFPGADH